MFNVREFNKETDLEILNKFLKSYEMPPEFAADLEYLPPTGIIVFSDETPVVMGFMIKCDNKTAVNTDFISDKSLPKELRNEAAQILRSVLASIAKESGITYILCFTKHEKLKNRLIGFGFTEIDQNLTQLGRGLLWP